MFTVSGHFGTSGESLFPFPPLPPLISVHAGVSSLGTLERGGLGRGYSIAFLDSFIVIGRSLLLPLRNSTSTFYLLRWTFYILPPGVYCRLSTDQRSWIGRPGVKKSGAQATPGIWVK